MPRKKKLVNWGGRKKKNKDESEKKKQKGAKSGKVTGPLNKKGERGATIAPESGTGKGVRRGKAAESERKFHPS